jgi:hypothetical protein
MRTTIYPHNYWERNIFPSNSCVDGMSLSVVPGAGPQDNKNEVKKSEFLILESAATVGVGDDLRPVLHAKTL